MTKCIQGRGAFSDQLGGIAAIPVRPLAAEGEEADVFSAAPGHIGKAPLLTWRRYSVTDFGSRAAVARSRSRRLRVAPFNGTAQLLQKGKGILAHPQQEQHQGQGTASALSMIQVDVCPAANQQPVRISS